MTAAGTSGPLGAPRPGLRRVVVRELELRTIIGVHDYEKRAPQRILIDLDLAVVEHADLLSDQLEDVLDYAEVVRSVEQVCRCERVNLVETLAELVARRCLADARVAAVRVRVLKPDVIANAQSVGVEIERHRPAG